MGRQDRYRGIDAIPEFLPDGGNLDISWGREGRIVAIDFACTLKEQRVLIQDLLEVFDPCYAHVRIKQHPFEYIEHHLGGMYEGQYHLTTVGSEAWAISYAASFLTSASGNRYLRGIEQLASWCKSSH